jgi:hypothetical protein
MGSGLALRCLYCTLHYVKPNHYPKSTIPDPIYFFTSRAPDWHPSGLEALASTSLRIQPSRVLLCYLLVHLGAFNRQEVRRLRSHCSSTLYKKAHIRPYDRLPDRYLVTSNTTLIPARDCLSCYAASMLRGNAPPPDMIRHAHTLYM